MSSEYILETAVAFADVDRDQVLLLPQLFKLLQEAAIKHADRYGAGTRAIAERQASWVLNRMAVGITRYPRYEEPVRIVTWSAGVRGFKGLREFRVWHGDELLASASSLWLWVDLTVKMLARVPPELAAEFPAPPAAASFHPDIETLRIRPPGAEAAETPVTLRYSDVDANGHVNNTTFFDCLQTALVRRGLSARPGRIEIHFLREIPATAAAVAVRLDPRDGETAFGFAAGGEVYAQGVVR